jgi:hypothetical protein
MPKNAAALLGAHKPAYRQSGKFYKNLLTLKKSHRIDLYQDKLCVSQ